ncbi:MAG: hypothetical protein R3Y24_11820 [Eubacteriales bacterium]
MAGKKELQKTISFRLNIAHEDEKALYDAIIRHGRGAGEETYSSSGAYIKMVLKDFHKMQEEMNQQENMQEIITTYMEQQAEKQRELFLQSLEEHDKKLVNVIVESVVNALLKSVVVKDIDDIRKENFNIADASNDRETVEKKMQIIEKESDDIPEEAFSYLQNL